MNEFEIINSVSIYRNGELVAQLDQPQWELVKFVANLRLDRIDGIKLLRAISKVQEDDPWGLRCCRDLIDAALVDL